MITPEALVRDHMIYSCVMGSRAFGLATEDSDTDRRGVFLAPTALQWRFTKPPTHVEGPAEEQFSWELERFCELALRADPNVLEVLHSPLVEHADATGRELLALRGAFLSRQVHASFTGYALTQHRRLEAHVARHGEPRWKHAVHLLRLLTSCRDLLRTGVLTVEVGEERERLLAVKRGEAAWPDIEAWVTRLADEAGTALSGSPLPPEPDLPRVEDFLYRARLASALRAARRPGPRDETVRRVAPAGAPGDGEAAPVT
ncbi:nucleotidyltransferase domain-containing protein [Streptomyces sp. MUM 203J]|uniref:nucleotidyltransferase domain-containing protein n=1 Tax=Streptomyces sp. MUM 203J TaxID=2791990 RepID=UPI001F0440C8|nr:nucleotidyltransferase domain-containing protein [Streptomyces sp. MUM 203J]MCH0543248.1 nucleotidyltransferase domain-containing protein [Streptomyces sp. MUM 203J]